MEHLQNLLNDIRISIDQYNDVLDMAKSHDEYADRITYHEGYLSALRCFERTVEQKLAVLALIEEFNYED